jgi:hypothetical protein
MSDTTSDDQGSGITGFNVTPGSPSLVDDFVFFVLCVLVGNIAWEIAKVAWFEFSSEAA